MRVIGMLATVYITILGPCVLHSVDPNWQAASKAFSSLTEFADPVKVRMAATSFHIILYLWSAEKGRVEAASTQRLPSRDISAQAFLKLSEIAPAQLSHATTLLSHAHILFELAYNNDRIGNTLIAP